MELNKAIRLAYQEMAKHNLFAEGWNFEFDRSKKRFGCCKFGRRVITLSRELTLLNDEANVLDTIRHEIAHALAGYKAGHGPEWVRKAREIGCVGKRCYGSEVVRPEAKYTHYCPNCGVGHARHRKTRTVTACRYCCDEYAGGKFDYRFLLKWKKNF